MTNTQIISAKSEAEWVKWLDKNHAESSGIWLQIFKKDSGRKTVTYAQALDGALCYGWIDGLKKSFDAVSWIQKFTPRRPKSGWSKNNTGHVERLSKLGRMKPAGVAAMDAAKADGRWQAAYSSPSKTAIPEDFLSELSKNKRAQTFFATLDKTNRYSIAWRLQSARNPELRAKRMKAIIEKLARKEKFHG